MVVLQNQLSQVYEEIDMVTTPTGRPVAMVHCNNCCTDLDYWVSIFSEFAKASGSELTKPQIYDLLYNNIHIEVKASRAVEKFQGKHWQTKHYFILKKTKLST